MNKTSVFGSGGFIGKEFCKMFPNETIPIKSGNFQPQSNKILYLRSTVSNYTTPEENIEINLINLMKVLQNLKEKDFFFYAGTWFSFGLGDYEHAAAQESDYNKVLGFYAASKLCAESFVETYCKNNGIRFQIYRFSNIIGIGDKFSAQKNALQFLINQLYLGKKIELYEHNKKPGGFYRNYLDVSECCRAINFLMDFGNENKYNIGYNKNYRFCDLIEYCADKLESKSLIVGRAPSDFHKIIQTPSFRMDCSKLRDLGFEWKKTIWETLDKILEEQEKPSI